LRGVVSQRLLPKVDGGRVAAVEVLVNTARIADLIRDPAKTDSIPEALAEGDFHQMQTFAQHLVELVLDELVDLDTAAAAATNRHDFEIAVQQALRRKQASVPVEPAEEPETEDEPNGQNGVGLRVVSSGE
jgi:Tfp pilus assembly pilus retraction ATPase PilT